MEGTPHLTRDEVEALEADLGTGEVEGRLIALERLGELGGDEAVRVFETALANDTGRVRAEAAYALGRLGDHRSVPPLIDALGDPEARTAAAWALGRLGDSRAVGPLIRMLEQEREELLVQAAAANALVRIGDTSAMVALHAVAHDTTRESSIRRAAAQAAARLDPRPQDRPSRSIHLLWVCGVGLIASAFAFGSVLGPAALIPLVAGAALIVAYRVKAEPDRRGEGGGEWGGGEGGWAPSGGGDGGGGGEGGGC